MFESIEFILSCYRVTEYVLDLDEWPTGYGIGIVDRTDESKSLWFRKVSVNGAYYFNGRVDRKYYDRMLYTERREP